MKIIEIIKNMFGLNKETEKSLQEKYCTERKKQLSHDREFRKQIFQDLERDFDNFMSSDVFKEILEKTHKENEYCESLEKAMDEGDIEKLRHIVNKKYEERNDHYLRVAVICGNTNAVKVLLENGADIHQHDDICLRDAISIDFAETVKVLIENGANIHASGKYSFFKMAVMGEKINTVKFFLIDYNMTIPNELLEWMEENNHQEALDIYKKRELNKKLSQTLEKKQEKRKINKI